MLTKSRLLQHRQCAKRVYLAMHQPALAQVGSATKWLLEQGANVGALAREIYGPGVTVSLERGVGAAVAATYALLDGPPQPIFEATFLAEDVLVRVDILLPESSGYRAIEVKESTSIKKEHRDDCAVQYWVMQRCGRAANSFSLAYINKSFEYQGDGRYDGLFHERSMDAQISAVLKDVPEWIESARASIHAESAPEIATGEHCHHPHDCPFIAHCSGDERAYAVTHLPRATKLVAELMASGLTDLRDVPDGKLTRKVHRRMKRVVSSGQAELDPAAREYARALTYPRYYFDFESINFAVPVWKGIRPYQQVPFQWSCHKDNGDGVLTHSFFLDDSGEFPARSCLEQLLVALGTVGPILTYNSSFERARLKELAAMFPQYVEQIEALMARIEDLLPLMQNHYYHPSMQGAWSIKKVLPALVPDVRYADLEQVRDGAGAQHAYMELRSPGLTAARREQLRRGLLAYCKTDTFALVKLVESLAAAE